MGATAGTKGKGVFAENHQRKQFKELNRTDDIEGARAGSLRKAPKTLRVSNPLDPAYTNPGEKDLLNTQSAFSKTQQDT